MAVSLIFSASLRSQGPREFLPRCSSNSFTKRSRRSRPRPRKTLYACTGAPNMRTFRKVREASYTVWDNISLVQLNLVVYFAMLLYSIQLSLLSSLVFFTLKLWTSEVSQVNLLWSNTFIINNNQTNVGKIRIPRRVAGNIHTIQHPNHYHPKSPKTSPSKPSNKFTIKTI